MTRPDPHIVLEGGLSRPVHSCKDSNENSIKGKMGQPIKTRLSFVFPTYHSSGAPFQLTVESCNPLIMVIDQFILLGVYAVGSLCYYCSCRSGICTTPIHVTSSQLISSEVFPLPVVKGLLYPGAIVNGLIINMTVPSWNNLLSTYNLTDIKNASAVPDLQRLEVLAGSYFCVAGSLIGMIKPGRMSMFGTLLVVWGLVKEGILAKPVNKDQTTTVFVYPTMLIALVSAFLSVKYDIKKAARSAPAQPVAKPLKSSSKSKLK
ncbi:hypothetical protein DH2020_046522 [Rehmannia glutinosa]|uniref:Uncharacterized protein n=1 Tax=Rehmannia glutinosa TaxID=99300 RepID=A0ABR0UBJ7_REHGL